jgi:hypothetical protein
MEGVVAAIGNLRFTLTRNRLHSKLCPSGFRIEGDHHG